MNQKTMLEEILALTSTASRMIVEDGASVDVEVPVKVVGDIHGQYEVSKLDDLLHFQIILKNRTDAYM